MVLIPLIQDLMVGQSFILGNNKESVSATATAFATFQDADSVNAQAYGGNVDVEFL